MSDAVCPQRILKEAVELLEELDETNQEKLHTDERQILKERVTNCVQELEEMSKSLYQAGIIWIKPDGTHSN